MQVKGSTASKREVTVSRPLRYAIQARLRIVVTLGLFVVYPACASVQHEGSTSVLGYGAGGVTGDSSFDCDGTRTSTVEHTQVGAGGEVVRKTRGALGGGARAAAVWGHVSHEAVAGDAPLNYGLGNVGVFITGDYEWVGHELGLGLTFRLDQGPSVIPSPWYRLRLGRRDVLFAEVTAGSRDGFVLDQSVAALALGVPTSSATIRLGVRWGGRAVASSDPDFGGLTLALNSHDTGDVSAYLETEIHLSESTDLFASIEAGGQLPALRVGLIVHLDDAPRPCSGACASEPESSAPAPDDEWDDAHRQRPTPPGAPGLTAPRP